MSFLSKLFSFSSGSNQSNEEADLELIAPVSGTLITLDDVPDPVICERIAGDGCALIPDSNSLVAPCDGVISRLLTSNSAFVVKTACGAEIYVKFGVGTDFFSGVGFSALKKVGDSVKAGDEIIKIDMQKLADKIKTTVVSMIAIKSTAQIDRVTCAGGSASAGQTPCMWVFLKKA